MIDKLSLRGQFFALSEPSPVDGFAQLIGDLTEDRTIARRVQVAEEAARKRGHVCTPLGI
ncbi:hypothetical protein [Streptomyces sp. NPDC088812]|uniref:hypothetical protein n=1 Tax=Streptomyces sp. NPDC088812 TaxID=3365905 RepID=UPI0037FB32BD